MVFPTDTSFVHVAYKDVMILHINVMMWCLLDIYCVHVIYTHMGVAIAVRFFQYTWLCQENFWVRKFSFSVFIWFMVQQISGSFDWNACVHMIYDSVEISRFIGWHFLCFFKFRNIRSHKGISWVHVIYDSVKFSRFIGWHFLYFFIFRNIRSLKGISCVHMICDCGTLQSHRMTFPAYKYNVWFI